MILLMLSLSEGKLTTRQIAYSTMTAARPLQPLQYPQPAHTFALHDPLLIRLFAPEKDPQTKTKRRMRYLMALI